MINHKILRTSEKKEAGKKKKGKKKGRIVNILCARLGINRISSLIHEFSDKKCEDNHVEHQLVTVHFEINCSSCSIISLDIKSTSQTEYFIFYTEKLCLGIIIKLESIYVFPFLITSLSIIS